MNSEKFEQRAIYLPADSSITYFMVLLQDVNKHGLTAKREGEKLECYKAVCKTSFWKSHCQDLEEYQLRKCL